MKKILALIAAVMMCGAVLSGCGGNDDESSAEEASEISESAVEDAEETTESADSASTTDANIEVSDEYQEFIEILKENVPIYGAYIEESTKFPVYNSFFYTDEDDEGTYSVEMEVIIAAINRIAVNTVMDEGAVNIIVDGNMYYLVSPDSNAALYMELDDETAAELTESLKSSMNPSFDASAAEYESGKTDYNGTEYLYETINVNDEESEINSITVYADTETEEIKYIDVDGSVMEMKGFGHDIDESVFVIPDDYELINMEDMD